MLWRLGARHGFHRRAFRHELEGGSLMMVLVETIDREVAILAGGVHPALHGLFTKDPGVRFVGCGAHGLHLDSRPIAGGIQHARSNQKAYSASSSVSVKRG